MELVRQLNQNRVRILMYHRFPRRYGPSFDQQCAFLASKYNVVPLEEAAQRLEANEPLTNMAVITVDDGYADMHEVAFPILQKHKLPATLFITTGFIQRTHWMPGDRVRYFFAHTPAETVNVTDDNGHMHTFRTKGSHATDGLRELLKRVPERTKQRMLSELDRDMPVPNPGAIPNEYKPCTWDQLRELAAGGVSIGAHTVTHPILSRLESASDAEGEIVQSKTEIEARLDRPVQSFAYPNGTHEDINQVSVDCARSQFKAAVTAISGLNGPGSDLHRLLRLPCDPDLPVADLARMMAGPIRRSGAPHLAAASY